MADPENQETDNFVELDGVKYKEDPENKGQALMGEDNNLVPFEEKKEEEETPEETPEEKKIREEKEEGEEPPTRKDVKDRIIERRGKKIKKLEKEKKDKEEGGEGEEPEGGEGGEEVTPEGKKAIQKEVEKATKPILQSIRTTSNEQELANVLAKYPEAKKIEKQIRKYMDHDAYKEVSIEFIFLGLAAKKMDLQKKRDKADEEAEAETTGGHGKRKKDLGAIPDVRGMDDKQIDELVHKVKTGQFS